MNICKDCKYYEAEAIEECVNKKKAYVEMSEPARYEVVGHRSFGKCDNVVIDSCNMPSKDMEKQSCKIMTWDGSSYMSGANITEDFGCIKFEKKKS